MRFKKLKGYITVPIAAILLAGCAADKLSQPKQTGFLTSSEYHRLEEVASPTPGVQIFRYVSTDFKRTNWKGLMIDPIILYQTVLQDVDGKDRLTEEIIYQTRMKLDKELTRRIQERTKIVDQPGPHIGRLTVAITGADVEADSFKPWNALPVSAVLFAAKKASGLDVKTPSLVVEAKFRDSLTGTVLSDGVYIMSGETFRLESNSIEAFQKLAINWVTTAIKVGSAETMVK